jgi:hypothetical protein
MKILVTVAVVMVVAAAIIAVPNRRDHATPEQAREDRKNQDVFHVCFSFEYDQIGSGLGPCLRSMLPVIQEPIVHLIIDR